MYFPRENEAPAYIPRGNMVQLQVLVRYARKLVQENGGVPLSIAQWLAVTREQFNAYRFSFPARPSPSPHAPQPTARSSNRVNDFKRSIKRDETHYPELKDWDKWIRSVLTRAKAHDIGEVFDPDYAPAEGDEEAKELFHQKQVFAMTVLNRCVQTEMGRHFVRQHVHSCDAQAVYRKLLAHAKLSTSGQISVGNLVEYLNTAKLDSNWRYSTQKFLTDWRDKLRQLQEMTNVHDHYGDHVKKRMLEASVRLIPGLANIKAIDEHHEAIGQPPLTFDAYFNLLISAAVRRDQHVGAPARSRRTVNEHQVDLWEGFYQDDPWIAQATERVPPPTRRPYIAPELWTKLPTEAQQLLRTFKPAAASSSIRSAHVHDTMVQEADESSAAPTWTNDESGTEPMEIGEPTPTDTSADVISEE